jgi:hypothetical protein
VDLAEMKVIASIPVGKSPHGAFFFDRPILEADERLHHCNACR